jgi:hypothetical protein
VSGGRPGRGVGDVGEDAGGAQENVVLDGGACVDGDVVLNFDVVADEDAVGDHGVLAKGAVGADFGTAADVGEVPDAGISANDSAGVDDGCGMRLVSGHGARFGLGGGLREHLQDFDAIDAIGKRGCAMGDTIDEVLEFDGKRFGCVFEKQFRAMVLIGEV